MPVRCSLLVLALLTSLPAVAQEAAVLLLAPALDEDTAYAVETKLRDEATPQLPLPLRLRSETRALFDGALAAGLECRADDSDCLAQTGAILGVESLVYARVDAADAGHVLQLTLVDVRGGRIERQVEAILPPRRLTAEPPLAIRRLLRALLSPAATGVLDVQAAPGPVRVFVDGDEIDAASPLHGLLPGVRQVRVTGEGFQDSVHEIIVIAGETTTVPVTLLPLAAQAPSPPVGPRVALLAAGGGAVGAGLLISVAGLFGGYALAYQTTRGLPKESTVAQARAAVERAQLYGTLGVVAAGLGSALVLAGGGTLAAALLLAGE
jgi:hypothetical protein